MAYIYPTKDACIQGAEFPAGSFVNMRQLTTGTHMITSTVFNNQATFVSTRGTTLGIIIRTFFEFDTSGISVTPTYCKLELYGYASTAADLIAVRSTIPAAVDGAITTAHFDAIYDSSTELAASDGSGAGTLAGVSGLAYSAEQATWIASGYNALIFNATALADMVSMDSFKVCVMEYDHDYLDIISLGDSARSGFYQDLYSGTSRDPRLNYGAGTAAVTDNSVFFGCNF